MKQAGSEGGSPQPRAARPLRSPKARAAASLFPSCKVGLFVSGCWGAARVLSKVISGLILVITYTSQIGGWG